MNSWNSILREYRESQEELQNLTVNDGGVLMHLAVRKTPFAAKKQIYPKFDENTVKLLKEELEWESPTSHHFELICWSESPTGGSIENGLVLGYDWNTGSEDLFPLLFNEPPRLYRETWTPNTATSILGNIKVHIKTTGSDEASATPLAAEYYYLGQKSVDKHDILSVFVEKPANFNKEMNKKDHYITLYYILRTIMNFDFVKKFSAKILGVTTARVANITSEKGLAFEAFKEKYHL